MRDVTVNYHGSVNILSLNTQSARDWVNENVSEDHQLFGVRGLVVEPRYTEGIIEAMQDSGLEVI